MALFRAMKTASEPEQIDPPRSIAITATSRRSVNLIQSDSTQVSGQVGSGKNALPLPLPAVYLTPSTGQGHTQGTSQVSQVMSCQAFKAVGSEASRSELDGDDVGGDVLVLPPVHDVERSALGVEAQPSRLQYRCRQVRGANGC